MSEIANIIYDLNESRAEVAALLNENGRLVKNKNKSDGIWLHDIAYYDGEKWISGDDTWEDIVMWAYPINPQEDGA